MCFQTTAPPSNFDESSKFFLLKNFLKKYLREMENVAEFAPSKAIVFNPFLYVCIYICIRGKESRSFFRVRTWGCSIEGMTFTCEPQFAVIPLVLEQLAQIRKHLPAIAADQDIRVACNMEIANWFPFTFDLSCLIAFLSDFYYLEGGGVDLFLTLIVFFLNLKV